MPFPESGDNESEPDNPKDFSDGNEEEDYSEKIIQLNKIEGLNAFDVELMKFTRDQSSMVCAMP